MCEPQQKIVYPQAWEVIEVEFGSQMPIDVLQQSAQRFMSQSHLALARVHTLTISSQSFALITRPLFVLRYSIL